MMKWSTLIISPLIIIFSKNWIFIWSLFEMNTFAFIMMMNKKKQSESMLLYFLVQSTASLMILLSLNSSISLSMMLKSPSELTPTLILLSMALKSGSAPFYMWMPPIVRKISWENIFLLLSLQKLAPTFFIIINPKVILTEMLIFFSIVSGTMLQLTSINLKLLITFSSISHLSWMMISGILSFNLFLFYFSIYTILLFYISKESSNMNIIYILKTEINLSFSVNILSFSGMPPFLGFIPKWMIISSSVKINPLKPFMLLLIFMSCLNIYIYTRILFLKSMNKQNSFKKSNKIVSFSTIMNFIAPILLFFSPQ
uniref:NADH-ubiquinone oxidoreductase chain 2 n=1 Tax=Unionicola foili TaxID=350889 RepID=B3W621_9ACAR|nr:NADH dehydrogenase subunit 2 [Unionicola foili]ACF19649.1 NADH dehydrogenase subunit 2 [Unionicola foili]